jgi:hypothetical protein
MGTQKPKPQSRKRGPFLSAELAARVRSRWNILRETVGPKKDPLDGDSYADDAVEGHYVRGWLLGVAEVVGMNIYDLVAEADRAFRLNVDGRDFTLADWLLKHQEDMSSNDLNAVHALNIGQTMKITLCGRHLPVQVARTR